MLRLYDVVLCFFLFVVAPSFQNENHELEKLPICSNQLSKELKKLVFVSTLDGRVSALNLEDGGSKEWSVPTGPGPMLSSSIHRLELTNNGQWVRMIPSLSGGLYKMDGKSIEAVPITADNLLKSSFRYSDDLIISGGIESRTYGIDAKTGNVMYECSMAKCDHPNGTNKPADVVLVQRQTQTVRAIEPKSGVERWNFSVGQHELKLSSSSNCHNSDKSESKTDDFFFKVIVPEGLICAMSKSKPGIVMWKHKFEFPVVNAWHISKGLVQKVDLFGGTQKPESKFYIPESPVLYVGMHNKQLYIQESVLLQNKILENINKLNQLMIGDENLPSIPWKPIYAGVLGIEGSTDPILQITDETSHASTTGLSVLYASEYVNGHGFFLYGPAYKKEDANNMLCNSEEKVNITLELDKNPDAEDAETFIEEDVYKETETETPVQVIIVSFWYWWKEVMLTSVLTAILVNIIIQRRFISFLFHVRQNVIRQESSGETQNTDVQSIGTTVVPNQIHEYVSRYLTDFEPVHCLGKGGFGIVFEAKNKIDDCHYAIKRIPLSNKEESHDRMKREVKALAKLDHQNIVRYFNSWVEDPPPNWQETQDREWAHKYNNSMNEIAVDLSSQLTPTSEHGPSLRKRNIIKSLWEKASSFYTSNVKIENSFIKVNKQRKVEYTTSGSSIVFERSKKDQSESVIFEEEEVKDSNNDCSEDVSNSRFNDESRYDNSYHKPNLKRPKTLDLHISGSTNSPMQSKGKKYLYIQMQLCRRDSLKDWLSANQQRDTNEVLRIFNQIVQAVEYVHFQGLIHRDLKPSNIFFSLDGQIKVGDFGLVTAMADEGEEFLSPVLGRKVSNEKHTARVGTQLYMSPEQVSGQQYDYKVDIYSLGVILFELLTNFTTEMERWKTLEQVRKLQFPSKFNDKFPHEYELLCLMLSENPKKRPTTIGVRAREPLKSLQSESSISDDWHFQLPQRHRDTSFSRSCSGQE
ncbi:eukaryotic translation initiation factor 2-alpha kinase [Cimex lectularius]|uniref:non-specific serine/threonine protein kinase n=1 Tax=Cimex lectularius TaxID=79782 RepID=A0A8I6REX2_CIMLE|nr:eukaryotic translation initiation factor 2-alpha kinase [Cimex lectularius]